MDGKEAVEKPVSRGSRNGSGRKRYTYDERLRAVKLREEEGYPLALVAKKTGVSVTSLVDRRDFRISGVLQSVFGRPIAPWQTRLEALAAYACTSRHPPDPTPADYWSQFRR